MNYEKPQVVRMNAATAAIQMTFKNGRPYDNLVNQTLTAPAYEADE